MRKPRFLLTRTVPVVVQRRVKGSYVKGAWVEGDTLEITRHVNIQPLKPSEILMLPDADRTKEWYQLYCAEDLRTMLENVWDADEFEWQGGKYKVMRVSNFAMGVLDHYSAQAVRIG